MRIPDNHIDVIRDSLYHYRDQLDDDEDAEEKLNNTAGVEAIKVSQKRVQDALDYINFRLKNG